MQEIIPEIKNSDAVVIGSPVYMLQITSPTKAFVDRLFPLIIGYFTPVLKGKKAVWAFTQGTENTEAFRNYFEHDESMFRLFGFAVEKTLVAGNTRVKGDMEKNVLKEAVEIGNNLV